MTGVIKSEFLHISIQRSLLEVHGALDSMCSYIGATIRNAREGGGVS